MPTSSLTTFTNKSYMYIRDQLYEFGTAIFWKLVVSVSKSFWVSRGGREGNSHLLRCHHLPCGMAECEALLCSICTTDSPSANSYSPFPMESKGGGKIGNHNLPDALYTSCTWKGSSETSNGVLHFAHYL